MELWSYGVMDGTIYMEYLWAFMGIDGSLQVSADISWYLSMFMLPTGTLSCGYIFDYICLPFTVIGVTQVCLFCLLRTRTIQEKSPRAPKGSTWDHRIRAEHRSCTVVFHSLWASVYFPNLHSTCITFSLEWTHSTSNLPLAYIYIMFNLHSTYMQATFNLHSTYIQPVCNIQRTFTKTPLHVFLLRILRPALEFSRSLWRSIRPEADDDWWLKPSPAKSIGKP